MAWINFESPTVVLEINASYQMSHQTNHKDLTAFIGEDGKSIACKPGNSIYFHSPYFFGF